MNVDNSRKKVIGTALGVCLAVVGVAACGGGGGSDEPETETTVVESSTSAFVKNKKLPTTTRVPSTLKMPTESRKRP